MIEYPDVIRAWEYASSQDERLTLLADIYPSHRPAPLCLAMHGWHQSRVDVEPMAEVLRRHFTVIAPDMRGRGGSEGVPDANGYELIDAIDALEGAEKAFPEWVSDRPPRIWGASGGEGNAYALAAKCPDLFGRLAVASGISDYAEWYRRDAVGEFIDEMNPWTGSSPEENEEAYQARSGLYLLPNVLSPIAIWHGGDDPRVPVCHAQSWVRRAAELGIAHEYHELTGIGHDVREHCGSEMAEYLNQPASTPILPREGELLVGSFCFTKAFRITLSDPGRIAVARYRLDKAGRCVELALRAQAPLRARISISPAAQVTASFAIERCSFR